MEPLLPVLHALEAMPADVTRLAGEIVASVQVEISNALPVAIDAEVESPTSLAFDYQASDDWLLGIAVGRSAPLKATLEYPSVHWTAAIAAIASGGIS